MRVPLSWLREYVEIDLPIDELVRRLIFAGLEVNSVEQIGRDWDPTKIFVGQVLAVRPHPNADRLVLVTVDYGHGDPLEVVTGAPNLRVGEQGQKVVFAIEGARLIDPYAETLRYQTLKASKIRGVRSAGMVCSERELGVSDEHTGIVILPADAPVGTPLAEYWGDTILDIELTPNLAHCNSIVGVAREVAALAGGKLKLADPSVRMEGASIQGQIKVEIHDPDLCARYSAALITGVQIGPSPHWMQRRLTLAGMRPINNIVDITNYVMLEWGQPLHAFDYRRIRAAPPGDTPTIIVRRARPGERMMTLDNIERECTDQMLLITDGGGPVAVAGVMGGLESEVTEETTDILLEAANFGNISIRKTSAALKLSSEAAQRFGRGIDPELTIKAACRAAELMRTLAGGQVAQGFEDAYPRRPAPKAINLRASEVRRLLGITLDIDTIQRMLEALDYRCERDASQPTCRVHVPSYRLDVSLEADLIEDIARLYGYDRLPMTLMADEFPTAPRNTSLELEERVRDILVGCGLTEIISYSMTNLESIAKLRPDRALPEAQDYIRLANPLSHEREFMRRTLMNTTLETVASNLRFVERVALFEIAHLYHPVEGQLLPQEPRCLSVALTGPREARSWMTNVSENVDFYDLKGVVETLCKHLGISEMAFAPTQHITFHPGRCATLIIDGEEIGVLGEVHPLVRANLELPEQRVCLAELDLEKLLAAADVSTKYAPISPMPALKEDLAVVVAEDAPVDRVQQAIREAGGDLLKEVLLFDVYRGGQIGAGKKSLAYSLTFQAADKTLTSEEIAGQRAHILARLAHDFDATLRG